MRCSPPPLAVLAFLSLFAIPATGAPQPTVPAPNSPAWFAAREDAQKNIDALLEQDRTTLGTTGDELTISHHRMVGTLDPTAGTYAATTTETVTAKMEAKRVHLVLFRDFAVKTITASENGQSLAVTWHSDQMPSDLAIDQYMKDFPDTNAPPDIDLSTGEPPMTNAELKVEVGLNVQILTIELPRFTKTGEEFEITTSYAGPYANLRKDPFTDEAVYLDGFWFPDLSGPTSTFELTLSLPADQEAFSQGRLLEDSVQGATRTVHYKSDVRQGEIVLIAGPYQVRRQTHNGIEFSSFLFPETAQKVADTPFLDKSAEYVDFFSNLVGPYPYEAFAIIESKADIGQGFRGFTLLGGHVIGAHFLEPYALGHEILHSWFGNWLIWNNEGGNWCEGITYYLANLYFDEAHKGPEFARQARKETLEELSYVMRWEDNVPTINEFVTNDGSVSQAIGYYKLGMVFHGWRRILGDDAFFALLKKIVADYPNQLVGLDEFTGEFYDALKAQGKVSGDRATWVADYSKGWYDQRGIPDIALDHVFAHRNEKDGTYDGEAVVRVDEPAQPFGLMPPLKMEIYDGSYESPDLVYQTTNLDWDMDAVSTKFSTAKAPNWVEFDPDYDQLRWIPDSEKSPCLTALLNTGPTSLVVPKELASALQDQVHFSQMFHGHVKPTVMTPADATLDKMRQQDILAVGMGADSGWIADLLTPPLGIRPSDLKLTAEERRAIGFPINLGDNDAMFLSVKNPDDASTTLAYAYGKDLASLVVLLKKLPFYPQDSMIAVRGGAVVEHDRSTTETRSLRFSVDARKNKPD